MAALPAGTIAVILVIWLLVTVPLTTFMAIAGKNGAAEFDAPCRTNKYTRVIPELPWYRTTPAQMLLAGFLPFSAIYVELYYVFASVWGHKVFFLWNILAIVFVILLTATAFVTVALTYFQLAVEDHRWWWRSFLCGGSTGALPVPCMWSSTAVGSGAPSSAAAPPVRFSTVPAVSAAFPLLSLAS